MTITVLQPGTQTLIMDAGRPGHRHQGIPGGGAADRLSFAIANHGAQMWSQNQGLNLPLNKAVQVDAGDILTMSFTRAGCRAYLAIAGGIEAQTFMGSVSTYLPAKLGGMDGEALRTGHVLKIGPKLGEINSLPKGHTPILSNHIVLRAQQGPEWDALSDSAKRYLFTTPFYATTSTDRMGTRLKGDQLTLETPVKMTSSPLLPAQADTHGPYRLFKLISGSSDKSHPEPPLVSAVAHPKRPKKSYAVRTAFMLISFLDLRSKCNLSCWTIKAQENNSFFADPIRSSKPTSAKTCP